MATRIKKDDLVKVLRGRDEGKQGKVQRVLYGGRLLLVEGVNISKRHLKAGAQGARQAGIVDKEMPLDSSKVMPICSSCGKPTRVGIRTLEDGTRSRVCKKCNEMMD